MRLGELIFDRFDGETGIIEYVEERDDGTYIAVAWAIHNAPGAEIPVQDRTFSARHVIPILEWEEMIEENDRKIEEAEA